MDDADGARLEQLEVDISDVASALETVDRIVAESPDGDSAASEIAAVVSPQRFPLDTDGPIHTDGPIDTDGPIHTDGRIHGAESPAVEG